MLTVYDPGGTVTAFVVRLVGYIRPGVINLTPKPAYRALFHKVPPVTVGVIVTGYPYGNVASTVVLAVAITPFTVFPLVVPDVAGGIPVAAPDTTGRVVMLKGTEFMRNVIAETAVESPETETEP